MKKYKFCRSASNDKSKSPGFATPLVKGGLIIGSESAGWWRSEESYFHYRLSKLKIYLNELYLKWFQIN